MNRASTYGRSKSEMSAMLAKLAVERGKRVVVMTLNVDHTLETLRRHMPDALFDIGKNSIRPYLRKKR